MRTRERLSTRLISGNANSRLDRLLFPENPSVLIDAFRNLRNDLKQLARTTDPGTGVKDGFEITNDISTPLRNVPDKQQRLCCAYGTGVRLGYVVGLSVQNRIANSNYIDSSGGTVNWIANANALFAPGTVDPVNLNNGGFSSQTAGLVFALAADATLIASPAIAFAGQKTFSIWVRSLLETPVTFDMQITSGTWVSFTAPVYWKRFSLWKFSGPATPGIRLPAASDGLILFGPQVSPANIPSEQGPPRLTVGVNVVLDGSYESFQPKTQVSPYGTFVINLSLKPLEFSAYVYAAVSNFDATGTTGYNGNFLIEIDNVGTGNIYSFGDVPETIEFAAFSTPDDKVKLVVRTEPDYVTCFLNGIRVVDLSYESSGVPLNFWLQGLNPHIISFQGWTQRLSDSKCLELSRL